MNKKHELRKLLNKRSIDAEKWRGLWKQAGAKSGVLDDMSDVQLTMLLVLVQKVPPMRKGADG